MTDKQDTEQAQQDAEQTQEPKTFTQEQVNEMMGKVRREAKAQFTDYAELKVKAEKLDALEEASKSEQEKLMERLSSLEKENAQMKAQKAHSELIAKVAAAKGVPSALLHGETEDDIAAVADSLIAWSGGKTVTYPADKGGAAHSVAITKDEIDKIKDPVQRIKMRTQNMGLYR